MTTETLPTELPKVLEAAVNRAAAILRGGGIVALPTETVYGLAGNALDAVAVAKIFEAKERPAFDPLIVHLPHREAVAEVADVPSDVADAAARLANAFWPGPLTMVLPKKPAVPDLVTSGLATVAVRVPAHPVFRRVLRACGFPLAAPSANRFGRISPTSASAVLKELDGLIPLVLDGGACAEGIELTIIRIVPAPGKSKPVIEVLRAGPVTKEALQEFGQVRYIKNVGAPDAPGQLPSHYAPRTPLRLLDPGAAFVPQPGRRYGLLSYSGNPKSLSLSDFAHVAILSPGTGKLQEAAIRLFAMLRQLDEAGVDEIIAEPVSDTGLGVAIMDRLRKAAGPRSQ